jgi:hypothetical protein
VNGRQREQSFADEIDAQKRIIRGSGLRKAQDFQLELTRGKRAEGRTYIDPKAGKVRFAEAYVTWIASQPIRDQSREHYARAYRVHVAPVFGHKTLAQAAGMRAELETLLNATMSKMSVSVRGRPACRDGRP